MSHKKTVMITLLLTMLFLFTSITEGQFLNITKDKNYSIVYAVPRGGFHSGSFKSSSSHSSSRPKSSSFKSGSFKSSTHKSSSSKGFGDIFNKKSSSSKKSYTNKRSFIPIPIPIFRGHRSYFGGSYGRVGSGFSIIKLIVLIILISLIIKIIKNIRKKY